MQKYASLILRLGLGTMFLAHGLQKAFGLFDGPGIDGFATMLSGLGFSPPVFWAYAAAYAELLGGLFLILGILTRISSALLLVLIVVAAATVHARNGFFMMAGGFEYNFIIACACVALILLGPGELSLNERF
jgi:putative oxidoreductase